VIGLGGSVPETHFYRDLFFLPPQVGGGGATKGLLRSSWGKCVVRLLSVGVVGDDN
jgi:hypothetical protein